jgi:hypothetical protein
MPDLDQMRQELEEATMFSLRAHLLSYVTILQN